MNAAFYIQFLLLVLALVAMTPAVANDDAINADRPGFAESSAVVGKGRFQIETGIQKEFSSQGGDNTHTVFIPTLLRLGINKAWELRIESNVHTWEHVTEAAGTHIKSDGDSPVSLGTKYRFQEGDNATPSLGLIVRISPRSGSGNFRSQATTGDVRLVADWEFSPKWSLNPNIGYARYGDAAGQTFSARLFAATVEYKVSEALSVFLDGALQSPESRNGSSATMYDAGLTYLITSDTQLDFSVGVKGSGQTSADRFIGAGVSIRF